MLTQCILFFLCCIGFLHNSCWCSLQGQKSLPSATCCHWVFFYGEGAEQKPLGLGLLVPLGRGQGHTGFIAPDAVFISDCRPVPDGLGFCCHCCQQTGLPTGLGCKMGCSSPLGLCWASLSWSFDKREQAFLGLFCLCLSVVPACKHLWQPGQGCMGDK